MARSSQNDGSCANNGASTPSFKRVSSALGAARIRRVPLKSLFAYFTLAIFAVGCGTSPAPQQTPAQNEAKAVELAVPEDIQNAADALLGRETKVLAFGDLAKTGKQQFLAANVIPKTPKNNAIAGTIVTRAVVAENDGGKWSELFRCDEHLKNQKGYLGLTPLETISGWRIQFEQDPQNGLQLYLTPMKAAADPHVLPIGVRWNPATKRYQSLDRTYEHFLPEAATLDTPRSSLR